MIKMTIPQDIRELSRQRAPGFYRLASAEQPDGIEPGQIWSTRSLLELPDGRRFETGDPRLVVVLDGEGGRSRSMEQITVAPLSVYTHMAAELDLIVTGERSPLGFDFLAEVWNETPMLKGHLRRFLAQVPKGVQAALTGLYQYQVLDDEAPAELAEWVGPPVMGEADPRLAFQESEIRACGYLARAATAALALDVTAPESVQIPTKKELWKAFDLALIFDKAFRFTREMTFAAGAAEDRDGYFVCHTGDQDFFTFELLSRRQDPYEVYFHVINIAPELNGRNCVIAIRLPAGEFKSDISELKVGAKITVGYDPLFKAHEGQTVRVDIY